MSNESPVLAVIDRAVASALSRNHPAPSATRAPVPAHTEAETRAKAAAFDAKMAVDGRALGRKSMLKMHGMTEADLASKKTEGQHQADALAALPKSLVEAKGDARAFGKADRRRQAAAESGVRASTPGRASMAKELRKPGLEPAR